MATDVLQITDMNNENCDHPDFKRLDSEGNAGYIKPKTPGLKKSISWSGRSDESRTISYERKHYLTCTEFGWFWEKLQLPIQEITFNPRIRQRLVTVKRA